MSIIYQDLPVVYDTGEILQDKTDWRTLKLKSTAVSKALTGCEDSIIKRSARMENCGSSLQFACSANGDKRLMRADFCRDRMCPACQKRRSLVVFHQVKNVCLSLQSEFKSTNYLLLTLTVPNVPVDDLRKTMSAMNMGWTKMAKRKEVKKAVWGWFKALEVTCSHRDKKDSSYHPHFHILLAVPGNYFKGRNYIKHERWLELWQESMKMPEITQVDVRKVKPNPKRENSTAIESAAAEVGKYATKPSNYITKFQDDYFANELVVNDLARALAGARLTAFGGRMKEHYQKLDLQDVEGDSVDLVHVNGDNQLVDAVMVQVYRWNVGVKRYVN
jgi:plasmid rolling circle replication initiator protein Rep